MTDSGWLSFLAKPWLAAKLRRDRPSGAVGTNPISLPTDRLKIAAVQCNVEPVREVHEWSRRIERLFAAASDQHCHLIVFPEYLPLSLLGTIMPEATGISSLSDASIRRLLRQVAPVTFRHWHLWMQYFSKRYGMSVIAGSGLTLQQGQLVNVALGFDPAGHEVFRQPKWHPLADEVRWGVVPGPVTPLPLMAPWALTAVVCNDATYFETFRMAAAQGAKVVAVPIADPEARYTEGKARRGCFSQVQDVPMVGIVAAATGRLFGMRLTGKAGIYLPSALTPDQSGVLAESPQPVGEGVVTAVVSLGQITEFQRQHNHHFPVPPSDFLEALYQFEEEL